jgi:hypothetical protein
MLCAVSTRTASSPPSAATLLTSSAQLKVSFSDLEVEHRARQHASGSPGSNAIRMAASGPAMASCDSKNTPCALTSLDPASSAHISPCAIPLTLINSPSIPTPTVARLQ